MGDLCQKKTYTKSYLDHKKRYNRGAEEKIYLRDHHPEIAIIDRAMWDATQEELARRSPSNDAKMKHSNRYWASGKIRCGVCGSPFIGRMKHTSVGQTRNWCCHTHTMASAMRTIQCTLSEWISDKSLKYIVLYILNILLENKKALIDEMVQSIQALSTESVTDDNVILKEQIARLERRKNKLMDMLLEDIITKTDFKIQNERLDTELMETKAKIKESEESKRKLAQQQNRLKDVADEIKKILSFEDAEREEMLGTVIDHVTIYPDHVVDIKLKDIPVRFRATYHSTGKLSTYRTEIVSLETFEDEF